MGFRVLAGLASPISSAWLSVAFGERRRWRFPPRRTSSTTSQLLDPLRLHEHDVPQLKVFGYQSSTEAPAPGPKGVVSRIPPVYTIPTFRWWTPLNEYENVLPRPGS